MDTKITLLKEAGKLAAYVFVTVALAKSVINAASTTQVAFDAAFGKK
jgi:hypothetical protein